MWTDGFTLRILAGDGGGNGSKHLKSLFFDRRYRGNWRDLGHLISVIGAFTRVLHPSALQIFHLFCFWRSRYSLIPDRHDQFVWYSGGTARPSIDLSQEIGRATFSRATTETNIPVFSYDRVTSASLNVTSARMPVGSWDLSSK